MPDNPKNTKVLLLGWDAADWKVIRPLIEEGSMPHLAGLMARGVHGNLSTIHPPLSPTLWTSIATGKRPPKHGILGFTEPTPDGRAVRPVSILSRKTKALWNILAQNGRRSVVVGWWPSHPAEPIPGVMVSDLFRQVPSDPEAVPPPPGPGTVHPPEMVAGLADLRVQPHEIPGEVLQMFVPGFANVDQNRDKSLHDLARILAETLSVHCVATELLETEEWDFAAVYFDTIDHMSHRFMRYHPPRLSGVAEPEYELYKDVVANAYRHHDAMLGRYLELVPPDTHVIVLSDHGFHSDALRPNWIPAEPAGPAVEHRNFGIFVMAGPGIRRGERIYGSSILDMAPTVLTLFGLPSGEDMDGRAQVQAWEQAPQVETVPSWDDVPGSDGRHSEAVQQDPREAAAAIEQLVALGYIDPLPDNAARAVKETSRELDFNLARALVDAGRPHEAVPLFQRLWDAWPDEHRFGLHLFGALNRCGRTSESRQALDTLRSRASQYATEAATKLEELHSEPREEPLDAIAARHPARRREAMERHRLLEHAAGLEFPLLRCEIGQLILEKRLTEACTVIDQILARGEPPPGMIPFLAASLARTGREGDDLRALGLLDTFEEAVPDEHLVGALRAEIHHRRGDWKAVVDACARSLGLVYFQPRLHALLGLALLRMGRNEEAIQELLVAIQQHPGETEALQALEMLHRNDPAKALLFRSRWEATLTLRRDAARRRSEPLPPTETEDYAFHELCSTPPTRCDDDVSPPVIVSGLPRSGTSMLMRVLQAGGIPLLVDGERPADENNRLGYFELAAVKASARDTSWLNEADGRAVKVVAPLLPHLPANRPLKVLVLHRPLRHVLASQQAMIQRLGTQPAADQTATAKRFASQMEELPEFLEKRSEWQTLHIAYEAVLADPRKECQRLAAFLGHGFDPVRAAEAVDPSQKRFG